MPLMAIITCASTRRSPILWLAFLNRDIMRINANPLLNTFTGHNEKKTVHLNPTLKRSLLLKKRIPKVTTQFFKAFGYIFSKLLLSKLPNLDSIVGDTKQECVRNT